MNKETRLHEVQRRKCADYGAEPFRCGDGLKVGISLNIRDGILPINGLRCNPTGDTCGWYIWAGEWSDDAEFFKPLHVEHLSDWCPEALPFLQLPPGWRFLVAPDHEDVWFDEELEL